MTISVKHCKKNRSFFLFLLTTALFWGPSTHGQEAPRNEKTLIGLVLEEEEGIPDVHILNLTAKTATITNAEGRFQMRVQRGDTLLISAVRYMRRQIFITDAILQSEALRIPMEPFVNTLDEVVVSPYDLTGDLNKDIQKLPDKQLPSAISMGLPNARARKFTATENRLNEATTGAGIVPLNPILNAISGRTKRLKKQLEIERRYQKMMKWRMEYPDSVITHQLNIPRTRIEDFMYFCEVDSEFEPIADSGNQLRIWGFLRKKSQEYRENNRLE